MVQCRCCLHLFHFIYTRRDVQWDSESPLYVYAEIGQNLAIH